MKLKKFVSSFVAVGLLSAIFHSIPFFSNNYWLLFTYSDVLAFAKRAISPGWIYINKVIEYPILVGNFIQLMGLAENKILYYIFSSISLITVGIFVLHLLYKMIPDDQKENLWTYYVFAPSMFLFLVYNWDILAVAFSVIAFYLIRQKKDLWASFFLALGFMTKVYPGFFLVPLLMKQSSWKLRIQTVSVFIISITIPNIFFATKNYKFWWFFFRFSSERGADFGSLWKLIIPLFPPYLYDIHTVNIVSFTLFVVLAAFVLWRYRRLEFLQLCFWITLLFILFNKVFSPQYILWLLPFFVLLSWKRKFYYYGLELANAAFLFAVLLVIFPPSNSTANIFANIFAVLRLGFLLLILIVSVKERESLQTA